MIGCSSKPSEKVIHQRLVSGEFDMYYYFPVIQIDRLLRDSLEVFLFDEEPFTGVAQKFYPMSTNYLEKVHLFQGKRHGYHLYYSPMSDTLLEVLFNTDEALSYNYNKYKLVNEDSLLFADTTLTGTYTRNLYVKDSTLLFKLQSRFSDGFLVCLTFFNENDSLLTEFETPENLLVINDTIFPRKD